jgi:hypothetical protein
MPLIQPEERRPGCLGSCFVARVLLASRQRNQSRLLFRDSRGDTGLILGYRDGYLRDTLSQRFLRIDLC